MFNVGDKVSVNHPKHPGIWIIKSLGPVNAVLAPVSGGRSLRAPQSMLIDPTEDRAESPRVTVSELYHPGELVRVPSGKFAGVWVVIKDGGTANVSMAKLGGDNGRYLRMSRGALVKVHLSEVLK